MSFWDIANSFPILVKERVNLNPYNRFIIHPMYIPEPIQDNALNRPTIYLRLLYLIS
jgi:hypothetical protein